jgi:hypothetical protein
MGCGLERCVSIAKFRDLNHFSSMDSSHSIHLQFNKTGYQDISLSKLIADATK